MYLYFLEVRLLDPRWGGASKEGDFAVDLPWKGMYVGAHFEVKEKGIGR